MSIVEAWIQSWDKKEAQRYAQHVQNFCGVPTHVMCEYDHEPNVLNAEIMACRSKYLWFLTTDVDMIYPHTAKVMVEWMEAHPDVGVLCPNREGEPPFAGGRYPFDKYLADNTDILYRMSVGAFFDPEFFFAGWNDLDFGEEVRWRGYRVQVDPRISVNKHHTPYGSWSHFRRAYTARHRLLLEVKWYWVGRDKWRGVNEYNKTAPPELRIPTFDDLLEWSDEEMDVFTASIDHEHPQIYLMGGSSNPGHLGWRMPFVPKRNPNNLSTFRRALDATKQIMAKMSWGEYNRTVPQEGHIQTIYQMSCWTDERTKQFVDIANAILDKAGN